MCMDSVGVKQADFLLKRKEVNKIVYKAKKRHLMILKICLHCALITNDLSSSIRSSTIYQVT
jgi:hypothetical protein